jgi:hypothetical protein
LAYASIPDGLRKDEHSVLSDIDSDSAYFTLSINPAKLLLSLDSNGYNISQPDEKHSTITAEKEFPDSEIRGELLKKKKPVTIFHFMISEDSSILVVPYSSTQAEVMKLIRDLFQETAPKS